jgi:hypothetical protein
MQRKTSLIELATELERQQTTKRDLIASTENVVAEVDGGDLVVAVGDKERFGVNRIGHAQIAEEAGIPKPYYDRMLANQPDLLAKNINTWLHAEPHKRMIRTLDGKVRAVRSDSYRPLENYDLAESVLPVLTELKTEIVSWDITVTRLYIKVVDKSVMEELPAGFKFGDGKHNIIHTRKLYPAVTISNSEVGMGSVSIQGGLYDGFCSNLAFFGERSLKKHHVGKRHDLGGEELYAILSDSTRRLSDAAVWAQVRDVVKAVFDRSKFEALVDKIKGATADEIKGDPIKVIDLSAKKFGFNEGERKGILRNLIEGGELTRFGLYNAITRTAQDLDDYDRASEFEQAGGKVIELNRNEWETLAKAA